MSFFADRRDDLQKLTAHQNVVQATQKLVAEFNYIRTNAVAPLSTFMDYITFVSRESHSFRLRRLPI
jgi:hypothetical protein